MKDEVFCFAHLRWCPNGHMCIQYFNRGGDKKSHLLFSNLYRLIQCTITANIPNCKESKGC